MPIYEFICRECGHRFEELVLSASASLEHIVCPSCGAEKPEKLISAVAFTGCSASSCGTCKSSSSGIT